MKPKQILLVAIIALTLLNVGCNQKKSEPVRSTVSESYTNPITVKDKIVNVEIANTEQARQQGLSNRVELLDGQGMLFDFTDAQNSWPSFWMKDMNFDIDIIWINNNQIIGINSNVPAPKPNTPNNQLLMYSPTSAITHVLEVPSGWTKKNNITVGDVIKL